jgi:hypothetical protein
MGSFERYEGLLLHNRNLKKNEANPWLALHWVSAIGTTVYCRSEIKSRNKALSIQFPTLEI